MGTDFEYITDSEQDTFFVGKIMGHLVTKSQLILLSGELGAGKTVLVKGLARGMGIKDEVTSPTYILINEYQGNLSLYHLDLYRLNQKEELTDIGLTEYLERDGVIVIEWPGIACELLPDDYLKIELKRINNQTRKLIFKNRGEQ